MAAFRAAAMMIVAMLVLMVVMTRTSALSCGSFAPIGFQLKGCNICTAFTSSETGHNFSYDWSMTMVDVNFTRALSSSRRLFHEGDQFSRHSSGKCLVKAAEEDCSPCGEEGLTLGVLYWNEAEFLESTLKGW